MSPLVTRPAQAWLRTLAAQKYCQTALLGVARNGAARRSYATENKDESEAGASFKGQMLESIGSRLARERAEREKFDREKRESAASKRWAQTFILVFAIGCGYFLGTKSPRDPDPTSTIPLDSTRAPKHNTTVKNMEATWSDFAAIVGKENVSTIEDDLQIHANSDWSSYRNTESQKPFMIVYPGSTEDVSKIMKVCHLRKIPVVGYSGGTSLEGHFTPTRGGICVDFRRMDKIIQLNKDDMDVVVQPSVGWEGLNELLGKDGLFFPPDPGPGAQIGGMIGTGCSGTNAYRYGTMRDWVISLTVVLADGTIIKTRQRPRKSSAGYDLTKLFIGSEGTLGLVTEATLKLTNKPANTSVAVCSFGTVRQAADCVAKVFGQGIPVAAVEILDDEQMRCINQAGMTKKTWKEAPTLFFKFSGTAQGVKEQIGIVKSLAQSTGSTSFEFAKSQEEQAELWSARKEALWSTMALAKPGDKVWTGDVAVPMSKLPLLIEETKDDMKKSGMYGTIVGHVGDGNFHIILLSNEEQRQDAKELVHRMVKRAVELEGTVTGEHGVGLVKRDYLPHELGETTVDLMRKIKLSLDPLCLLNGDKVVRVEKPRPGEISKW
ncbi:hypothetical protein F5Y16DRAFT_373246 [Xylariaceae sp. FL0255]|nr:hypothetical protein F5Y16DRAFT_373246 [Xylariaceae sp. FL0255]